jgi:hypothetical protein
MERRPALPLIALLLAAGCVSSPSGHEGARADAALHVRMVPVRRAADPGFVGTPPFEGGPPVRVSLALVNTTGSVIRVDACTAEAVDEAGRRLFDLPNPGLASTWLAPHERQGDLHSGWNTKEAEWGTTPAELARVDHYRVRCQVHRWVGPIPIAPHEEGD